jgi:uncharacterized metal-binding protein YceD (DUF177 family)
VEIMRIQLADMSPQGHQELFSLSSRWAVDAAARALCGEVQALDGNLSVVMRADAALVCGWIEATAERTCDRCGAPLHLAIEGRVELEYRREFSEDEGSRELSASDMALGFYESGCLDLSDAVCDHLALLLPVQVFCDQPNAEAVGVGCTQELLSVPDAVDLDSRFAVLQSLKLE